MLAELKKDFLKLADKKKAKLLSGYFKTGKGEYGEGDVFLGIVVPLQRKIAKKYINLSLNDLQQLLNSNIHEQRLIALLILVDKFEKANEIEKKEIFNFYLNNTKNINNWDLVDLSAPNIVGNYLLGKKSGIVFRILGDILACIFQAGNSPRGPSYLVSHRDIRFSTSSWDMPFPSLSSFMPAST